MTASLTQLHGKFPSTRYQGSKAKLTNWIWSHLHDLSFDTCLDAFGGTGAVAYRMKQAGKCVTYNDLLRFNHQFGIALIENVSTQLSKDEVDWILAPHDSIRYPDFIQKTFSDIYFTDAENVWLDRVITNIHHLEDRYQHALAFFALAQACIIKRPYNLFHRKNLYMRTSDVKRTFGNKATWDKPFEAWFRHFVAEANQAVFDNQRVNCVGNQDVFNLSPDIDLVYIDPPYISKQGIAVDYRDFYHFLEGLTHYESWSNHVDYTSKHRRLIKEDAMWSNKHTIHSAFDHLFAHFQKSVVVVSYRSDGIPTISELVTLLNSYKSVVDVYYYGQYQYVLSTNRNSHEVLLIGR